jgi:hypothetical protein
MTVGFNLVGQDSFGAARGGSHARCACPSAAELRPFIQFIVVG